MYNIYKNVYSRRIPRGNGFQPEDDDVLVDILWSDPMVVSIFYTPSDLPGTKELNNCHI